MGSGDDDENNPTDERGMMSTLQSDYLAVARTDWGRRVRVELLDPVRTAMLEHPFMQKAIDGMLSIEQCLVYAAEILYQVVPFGNQMAALAARCPIHDHEMKTSLLKNAYSEHNHPHMLAKLIESAGYDPSPILHGPGGSYRALEVSDRTRDANDVYAHQRPWVVGVAALAAGAESIVPLQVEHMKQVLSNRHGFSKMDLQWFEVHSGDVEIEHANEGLETVERYLEDAGHDLQAECWQAIERTSARVGLEVLDQIAGADPSRVLGQLRRA